MPQNLFVTQDALNITQLTTDDGSSILIMVDLKNLLHTTSPILKGALLQPRTLFPPRVPTTTPSH